MLLLMILGDDSPCSEDNVLSPMAGNGKGYRACPAGRGTRWEKSRVEEDILSYSLFRANDQQGLIDMVSFGVEQKY